MIAVALLVVVLLFLLLIIAIFLWPKSSSTTMTPSIVPAVLSPAQCRRIVERAKKEGLDRSTVLSDAKRVQTSRTSTNTFLSNDDPAIVPLVDLVERATMRAAATWSLNLLTSAGTSASRLRHCLRCIFER